LSACSRSFQKISGFFTVKHAGKAGDERFFQAAEAVDPGKVGAAVTIIPNELFDYLICFATLIFRRLN
jgi:hypothetical protein